jgi:hypothetical protein
VAKQSSGGESEYHIVATRTRVLGAGILRYSLEDYSQIQNVPLPPFTMSAATRIEPLILANFQSQRTRLIGMVTDINEWFEINRLIIFAKPVAEEYPQ